MVDKLKDSAADGKTISRAGSGPEFHVNSGSSRVGSLHLWVGLGRVKNIGSTFNSVNYIVYKAKQRTSQIMRCFCRAMLCISAPYAVMRCPSVRLSRSWIMSKRINVSSKFFHHRVATPF